MMLTMWACPSCMHCQTCPHLEHYHQSHRTRPVASMSFALPCRNGNKRLTFFAATKVAFLAGLSTVGAFAPFLGHNVGIDAISCNQPKRGFSFATIQHVPRRVIDTTCQASVSNNDGQSNANNVDPTERRSGLLVLLTVPMAWGTFEPAVRYVYDVQPDVPAFVFQLAYYLIATTSLATIAFVPGTIFGGKGIESTTSEASRQFTDPTTISSNQTSAPLESTSLLSLLGGIELGTYLFLGNGMQVVGLKTIPSDRAAFLLQLTTIFVPLVQSIVARDFSILPVRTWLACFIALVGVALIGFDDAPTFLGADPMSLLGSGPSFSQGDLYIVLAALFYTFHCLRLETYAKQTPAIQLAVAKASTETLWCGVVILVSLLAVLTVNAPSVDNSLWDLATASGKNILDYKEALITSLRDPSISLDQWTKLAAATAWIGLVTVGYTITAQSYGQARVPPATANLIYTIQPLFTAVVAFLVLGEALGPAGYAGGLLIGSAVLLVTKDGDEPVQRKEI